jgi:branched-subunit amino acid transport protein
VKTEVVSQVVIWGVIVGMAVSNFLVRFVPIAVMSRMAMPKALMRWLSFVPVSVMGALVAGEVLRPGGAWSNPLTGPSLYAAIVTALTFHFSRSFLGATVAGMASFVALQHLLPMVVR